jgi:CPA1 family monovalent cation:H+ antiporter
MALVGWINALIFRLPQSVAMLSAGILAAGLLFAAQTLIGPFWGFDSVRHEIARLNFSNAVVSYMLSALLFSSGMQVELGEFRRRRLAIWSLATLGVLASTALVGLGVWWISRFVGHEVPLSWALVFGALISPTDPIAVMALARSGVLSKRLGAVLQGEALFNDGVGLVVFTAALAFAASGVAPNVAHLAGAILLEVGGGLALGLAGGWLVIFVMQSIDDYVVELTASLALATGVYALARAIHLSGPIAAAAAGLLIGSYGVKIGMSEEARGYIKGFWHLADELLNGLLFLLTGLQIFVVTFDVGEVGVWISSIALVGLARLLVVMPWGAYFRLRHKERGASFILTLGGLRGGISLALAFTLPPGGPHDLLVATTFAVVIFSVLAQGLSLGPIIQRLNREHSD